MIRTMIRKYIPEDATAVIDLWLKASAISHSFIEYDYWLKNADAMKSVYLPMANTSVYVTEQGEIAGFIALVGNLVAALFVSPTHQNCGIGSVLLREAKERFTSLELYVYALNGPAIRFYTRNGFERRGSHTDPNTGELQYRMEFHAG
ncbi:MAG: GNAT family N-acetyltransferase [Bacteroidales bacterium]